VLVRDHHAAAAADVQDAARSSVPSCDTTITAYLLQECVMVRDGLAKLPDCSTVGDMCDIASYVSTC